MSIKKTLLIVCAVILYASLIATSYKHIMAELNFEKSLELVEIGQLVTAQKTAEKTIKYNKNEPRYFYNLAKVKLLNGETKETIYTNIETAIKLNPKNLVTLRNVSPYFYFLSLEKIDISENTNKNFDPKYRSLAKEFLLKLKTEYPNDLGVQVLIAKNEKRLELTKDYQETLQNIGTLRKDILEWHPDLK